MKKLIYSILILSLLLLVIGLDVAAEKVEVTIWHMEQPPHRVDLFQEVIDEFNKQNSDIYVKQQVIDWMNKYLRSILFRE